MTDVFWAAGGLFVVIAILMSMGDAMGGDEWPKLPNSSLDI